MKGTKYGISAASYPHLDIKNLTLSEAHAIYLGDYWTPARCPEQSCRLALVMFDAAVNNGVSRATRFLQTAVGSTADGIWGPNTAAALRAAMARDPLDTAVAGEVHAQRIFFMAGLSGWATFGLGWSRRLAQLPLQAALYWPSPAAPATTASA